ncbi:hypothetical protein Y032_0256g358 [Ancylostoma ceylanicum]|uniref:Uncharacterized protein n=1 Tax=Ancylostoma ceylanicum TaxID=53326 RepID=A0A016SBR3_9BILA|nr:hypothetical protein Y032_0256g358 [Ancylostoma ceylanicum]
MASNGRRERARQRRGNSDCLLHLSRQREFTTYRFSSVSPLSRPAASMQQTTRVPAPRSHPLSAAVRSSMHACFIHGICIIVSDAVLSSAKHGF